MIGNINNTNAASAAELFAFGDNVRLMKLGLAVGMAVGCGVGAVGIAVGSGVGLVGDGVGFGVGFVGDGVGLGVGLRVGKGDIFSTWKLGW